LGAYLSRAADAGDEVLAEHDHDSRPLRAAIRGAGSDESINSMLDDRAR
jgi:hypothetical protein